MKTKDTNILFNYGITSQVTEVKGIVQIGNIILIKDQEKLEKAQLENNGKDYEDSFYNPKNAKEIEKLTLEITNGLEKGYVLHNQLFGENNNMILSLVEIPSLKGRKFVISSSLVELSKEQYAESIDKFKSNLSTEDYKVSTSENEEQSVLFLQKMEQFMEEEKDLEIVDIVEVPSGLEEGSQNKDKFLQDFLENLERVTIISLRIKGKAKPTIKDYDCEGVA